MFWESLICDLEIGYGWCNSWVIGRLTVTPLVLRGLRWFVVEMGEREKALAPDALIF